jgi:hypothetical protein
MRKILIIVLAVGLVLALSVTSVTFAAGGKKEVALAQEAGQAWLDRTVAIGGEPLEWIGARLTTPQVYYDLKGKPNAYMFAIENNGEVVGYIIVGSSEYGYPMWEAADVPPLSIPSADKVKSTLKRDLGLDVASVARPTRLLYLGFDNVFAVYQVGGKEVAVNLLFDVAVAAANLKTAMPSPEVYKANNEAIELARPEQLQGTGDNALPLASTSKILKVYPYRLGDRYWCGPCSGVSIGWYYREQRGYSNLPASCTGYASCYDPMYDELVTCWGKDHPIWGGEYWDGFECMTTGAGYNNFNCVGDPIVTAGDYWNRVADINNNWPIAIFCWNFYYLEEPDTDIPHWMVIRGYKYPYQHPTKGTIQYAIYCADSWPYARNVYLDWNNIGLFPQTYTIKDS